MTWEFSISFSSLIFGSTRQWLGPSYLIIMLGAFFWARSLKTVLVSLWLLLLLFKLLLLLLLLPAGGTSLAASTHSDWVLIKVSHLGLIFEQRTLCLPVCECICVRAWVCVCLTHALPKIQKWKKKLARSRGNNNNEKGSAGRTNERTTEINSTQPNSTELNSTVAVGFLLALWKVMIFGTCMGERLDSLAFALSFCLSDFVCLHCCLCHSAAEKLKWIWYTKANWSRFWFPYCEAFYAAIVSC